MSSHGRGVARSIAAGKWLATVVLGAIVLSTAYGAFGAAKAFPRPVSLEAYVHGEGVVFAPAGAHYSVRFTERPTVEQSVAHAKGYDIAIRSVSVSTADYDLLLREDVVSVQGKDRAAAHRAEVLMTTPTMQRELVFVLRTANVSDAHPVGTKVDGYPALVYKTNPTPLNGSVAAAAIYAKGRIFTLLVHADADGDAVLHAFETSLRFSPH